MRLSRDTLFTIGLFIILAVLTAGAAVWQAQQDTINPPLSSLSADPNGAKALRDWLNETGYQTTHDTPGRFQPTPTATLALLLEPTQPISAAQWDTLDQWVEEGGLLFITGSGFNILPVFNHYDVTLNYRLGETTELPIQQTTPFFQAPPLTNLTNTRPEAYLFTNRHDTITHLAIQPANDSSLTQPVLISFTHGQGRVYLSTLTFPFSNEGLKETSNQTLAQNIIALTPTPSTIWFDEWHHGLRPATSSDTIVGPGQWLRNTPAGQALLYTLLITLLTLTLRGRYFGRPVPLPQDLTRRAPLEHITAIANLNRRAGHRQDVQTQYHHHLKRTLAKRYRLNPTLPDQKYVTQLALYKPDLDQAALLHLLTRLKASNISESELLSLAQQTHDLTTIQ